MKDKVIEIAIGAFVAKLVEEIGESVYPTNDVLLKSIISLIGAVAAVFFYEKYFVKSGEPIINHRTRSVLIILTYCICFYHFFSYKMFLHGPEPRSLRDQVFSYFASLFFGLVGGIFLSLIAQTKPFWKILLAIFASIICSYLFLSLAPTWQLEWERIIALAFVFSAIVFWGWGLNILTAHLKK